MPFTKDNAAAHGRAGGNSTKDRYGREHFIAAGQRGFDRTCEKLFAGDARAMCNWLIQRGLETSDPMPYNNAWQRKIDGRISDRLPVDWQRPARLPIPKQHRAQLDREELPF